jgi:hypothetical protein
MDRGVGVAERGWNRKAGGREHGMKGILWFWEVSGVDGERIA